MTPEETSFAWALAMWDKASNEQQIKSKNMTKLQKRVVFELHTDICLTNDAHSRSRRLIEILTGRAK